MAPRPPQAVAALRAVRARRDGFARVRTAARVALGLSGVGALAMGQPMTALLCFLGFGAMGAARAGALKYPLASRRRPANPHEASLLAMLPERLLRRVDAATYVVEPDPDEPRLELWCTAPAGKDAWFDLTLGPEPRVAGSAERVGPVLDDALLASPPEDRLMLRGSWLGWSTAPGARPLEQLVARLHHLARRLDGGSVRSPETLTLLQRTGPLVRATLMLADPDYFETWPRAHEVRPAFRWLARESGMSLETRLRATRMLAHSAAPEEVLELLDRLGEARPEGELADRAAHHLAAASPHLQAAAAALLARVGTPAQLGALGACRARERGQREAVRRAARRARAAIQARFQEAEAGCLAVAEAASGDLALVDELDEPG
jgi:hypothetical protein